MNLSAPIYRLKREARLLSRRDDIALAAALDRIAATEGFASWSLLAARYAASSPAARLYANLRDGELVLVAARPGHGKTLFALQLALEALRNGRKAHVFSLEYTRAQVEGRFEAIGGEAELAQLAIDTSDSIGSGHVEAALASAPAGTLAVIDYLQLLDQRCACSRAGAASFSSSSPRSTAPSRMRGGRCPTAATSAFRILSISASSTGCASCMTARCRCARCLDGRGAFIAPRAPLGYQAGSQRENPRPPAA
jgi:hypothetical protein